MVHSSNKYYYSLPNLACRSNQWHTHIWSPNMKQKNCKNLTLKKNLIDTTIVHLSCILDNVQKK